VRSHVVSLLIFFFLSAAAVAEPLQLKVVIPDGQSVANPRVLVYRDGERSAIASANTRGNGAAEFDLRSGKYILEILSPGFARTTLVINVPFDHLQTVELRIAGPSETVQVTATGTPMESAVSGADVTSVDDSVLLNQQQIALVDTLRTIPGAVLNRAGQRGGITSLFVRGGESRYNKVIIDGVPVNEVGGLYDFGTTSMVSADRVEFMRGAQSTLYGTDAVTSVVQVFSGQGTTRTPELRFGAEGGTFSTARGYASLAGALNRFDYNLFGEQLNTDGQGANDGYSLSAQGGNVGVVLTPKTLLRFRARHDNSGVGVQNEWVFGGKALLPPDLDGHARANNFLSSLDVSYSQSPHWRHQITGFEYNHQRYNEDQTSDRGCAPFFLDCPFFQRDHQNRAGFNYLSEWSPVDWTRSTFGFDLQNENGTVVEDFGGPGHIHGSRLNYAGYFEQIAVWKRLSATAGVRVLHNGSFGNRAVPRVSVSFLAAKGGEVLSGTRLRFTYAEGFLEPSFEQSFGVGGFGILPNPNLKPEENRSFETGIEQSFYGGKYSVTGTYFNNAFRNLLTAQFFPDFTSQYFNLNRSMAHGAEAGFHARVKKNVRLDASYTYD
jgi:outer membrane cobalamin receptor